MKQIRMPIDIITVFWYWFQHMFAVVIWCGATSSYFDIKSGVRQGSVASCWIFNSLCMVIDGLITKFEKSGYRCYFQGLFAGCILYADDVMLLSASLCKLQCMLNMCAEFAEEFGLSFNVKKSVCFVVGKEYGVGGLPDMCIGANKWRG